MNIEELIKEISIFAEGETQKLIAELQRLRFENDGAFNGHEAWNDNSPKVIKDKGFNKPLYDGGELKNELTTPNNWNLNPKFIGNTLTLQVPDREQFTASKYDKLDRGGSVEPYTSKRGNKINIHSVPARPFKDISDQDIQWIRDRLEEAIIRQYGNILI